MAEGRDPWNPDDRGYAPRRGNVKKNRKRWCRGKPGREHVPTIAFRPYSPYFNECRLPRWYEKRWLTTGWMCQHDEVCATCGKVLRPEVDKSECPTWLAQQES